MEQCMLMIFAPPALEESLVDWLLEQEQVAGFTTADVHGRSSQPANLSLKEQVAGRQRRVQFMLHADRRVIEAMVEALRVEFSNAGLHFSVIPLIDAGHI